MSVLGAAEGTSDYPTEKNIEHLKDTIIQTGRT